MTASQNRQSPLSDDHGGTVLATLARVWPTVAFTARAAFSALVIGVRPLGAPVGAYPVAA